MSLLNRKGDTRSIVAKYIQKHAYRTEVSPELRARVQLLRGDLESKDWRKNNRCLYCGLEAVEKDHYGCAVVKKRSNIYVDCCVNLVPSCRTCHRAGKDIRRKHAITTMEWWRGVGCRLSKNHPRVKIARHNQEHPDNIIDEHQVYRRLVAFHEFHERYAPRIPIQQHHIMCNRVEQLLDDMYRDSQERVLKIISNMQDDNHDPITFMNTLYCH